MLLFFAAFVAEWFYPGDITSRACAGAFILIVAFLVAWSIWTARDASEAWWFLSDTKKPGHRGEEPDDRDVYFGIPWLGLFKTLFTRRSVMSQSYPTENYAMQHTGGSNSNTEPNFWAG